MRPTMTRRQVLRASGGAVLGVTGAIALAACGETQVVTVEKIVEKEVPVETIVTKEVAGREGGHAGSHQGSHGGARDRKDRVASRPHLRSARRGHELGAGTIRANQPQHPDPVRTAA